MTQAEDKTKTSFIASNKDQSTLILISWLNALNMGSMLSLNDAAIIWINRNAEQYRKQHA